MGLFGFWQCVFLYQTNKDTHMNQILAGGLTGAMVNMRGGWRYSMRGFCTGLVFIGVFNVIEIVMSKKDFKAQNLQSQFSIRAQML